jgi:hypothetical protein
MTSEEPPEKKEKDLKQALRALMKVLENPLKPNTVAGDTSLSY